MTDDRDIPDYRPVTLPAGVWEELVSMARESAPNWEGLQEAPAAHLCREILSLDSLMRKAYRGTTWYPYDAELDQPFLRDERDGYKL